MNASPTAHSLIDNRHFHFEGDWPQLAGHRLLPCHSSGAQLKFHPRYIIIVDFTIEVSADALQLCMRKSKLNSMKIIVRSDVASLHDAATIPYRMFVAND